MKKNKKGLMQGWSKKKKVQLTVAGSILIILLMILMAFLQNKSSAKEEVAYTLYKLDYPSPLLFKGNIEPEHVEQFYLDQTLGKITEIHVQNGQQVEKGAVLLTYQNETQKEQVDQNEASQSKNSTAVQNAQSDLTAAEDKKNKTIQKLNKAKTDYNHLVANYADESAIQAAKAEVTELEAAAEQADDGIRTAKQALSVAQSELNASTAQIDEGKAKVTTTITSPIAGIVSVNEDGKSSGTTPVIQVFSPETIVKGQISEYDYARLKVDQSVNVKPTSTKENIAGVITFINQLPDAASNATDAGSSKSNGVSSSVVNYTFKVKTEKGIQYGYSVQIQLPLEELRIPKNTIQKNGEQAYVFVYTEGKVQKKNIQVEQQGNYQVVKEGLEKGDQIIGSPDDKLKDGEKVTVTE